jgi:hypothetical protein
MAIFDTYSQLLQMSIIAAVPVAYLNLFPFINESYQEVKKRVFLVPSLPLRPTSYLPARWTACGVRIANQSTEGDSFFGFAATIESGSPLLHTALIAGIAMVVCVKQELHYNKRPLVGNLVTLH